MLSNKEEECGYKEDNEPLAPSDVLSERFKIRVRNRKGKHCYHR